MREFYTADVSHLSSSLQQFEFCVKEMAPEVWDHFVCLLLASQLNWTSKKKWWR